MRQGWACQEQEAELLRSLGNFDALETKAPTEEDPAKAAAAESDQTGKASAAPPAIIASLCITRHVHMNKKGICMCVCLAMSKYASNLTGTKAKCSRQKRIFGEEVFAV